MVTGPHRCSGSGKDGVVLYVDVNFPCHQAAVSGGAAQPRNEWSAGGKDDIYNTIFKVSTHVI